MRNAPPVYQHYCDRVTPKMESVCGLKKQNLLLQVTQLLEAPDPCQKCLEWVAEQGRTAEKSLAILRSKGNEQQQS